MDKREGFKKALVAGQEGRFQKGSVSRGREVFREGGELVGEESKGCFCPPISPIIIILIVQWL